nr:trihelix transcription factor ASR3 [Tanacetum cinerariifolium]
SGSVVDSEMEAADENDPEFCIDAGSIVKWMALERLSLVVHESAEEEQNSNSKAPRLPRWTRQELLVLIQGKRVAENRVRRGRSAVMAFGASSAQVEPKWSSVSSYCKRHGVNRGPVQCRKRWSNLAGDFKKIKEWESQISSKKEVESFWVMRNDLRRERKLPGFFDREVYDILDGGGGSSSSAAAAGEEAEGDRSLVLSLAPTSAANDNDDQEEAEETDKEVLFDSGRTATSDDGLFSDEPVIPSSPLGKLDKEQPAPTPISATQYVPFSQPGVPTTDDAAAADKETSPSPETHQGKKRKRPATDDAAGETSLQNQLIEVMERNGKLLSTQLEIQNTNSQLDREQRRDHANSLFEVLNKLADAMVKIADKL